MILLTALLLGGVECHTSSRHVRSIVPLPDGRVRLDTMGGRVTVSADGSTVKLTEAGGLETHEPTVTASDGELRLSVSNIVWKRRALGLPSSAGTHPAAAAMIDGTLHVAMYGDSRLWKWTKGSWVASLSLPKAVLDPTVLRSVGKDLWLGTRRNGAWRLRSGRWHALASRGVEPYDHNAQAMAVYRDRLWVSTLEDGLVAWNGATWSHVLPPSISTKAPRDMVVWKDRLLLRHGDGQVDTFDGSEWKRDVFRTELPRKQAARLSTDGSRLFFAQWGGWSEFDGTSWTHRFPGELSGVPVTTVLPRGAERWVGTQGRGVVRFGEQPLFLGQNRQLPDDWVTHLADLKGQVVAGTFIGGLATWDGANWQAVMFPTAGITGLLASASHAWVASAKGIGRYPEGWTSPKPTEAQCLAEFRGSVWVGGRRGIYRLPLSVSRAPKVAAGSDK